MVMAPAAALWLNGGRLLSYHPPSWNHPVLCSLTKRWWVSHSALWWASFSLSHVGKYHILTIVWTEAPHLGRFGKCLELACGSQTFTSPCPIMGISQEWKNQHDLELSLALLSRVVPRVEGGSTRQTECTDPSRAINANS